MKKEDKHTIWNSFGEYSEEDYGEWLDGNGLTQDDISFEEWKCRETKYWADDEKENLNQPCNRVIAIADLGLWNGRHSGYRLLGTNVGSIFNVGGDYYDEDFYCDGKDCRADLYHHDGTNHILFREIRDGVNIAPLCRMLYNGEDVDRRTLNRFTKSLRPRIASIYGWN